MNQFTLSLRQRQILNYLQNKKRYVKGSELSESLKVSSRTIRNDISSINELLKGSNVSIISKHTYGYKIEAKDDKSLNQIIRVNESFLSKTDRLRHITLQLCFNDERINVYDLADEMYISKTTLDHDLLTIKKSFFELFKIRLHFSKNFIWIDDDERKKRRLLVHLYSEDWDYNGRANSYYQFEFITEKEIIQCMQTTHFAVEEKALPIEDVNLVHLNLLIVIAYNRIKSGHILKEKRKNIYSTKEGIEFTDYVLNELEEKWNITFNDIERPEIYELVSCSITPDIEFIEKNGVAAYFENKYIQFTNSYINHIQEMFQINLFEDQDFYNTLISYLRYIDLPIHNLNYSQVDEFSPKHLMIEFEIAYSIQELAYDFYGRYLDYYELIYLSTLISGALHNRTQKKIRACLLSHLNLPATWSLRIQIEHRFPSFIHVKKILPMHMKDKFDFKDIDLILATTKKPIISEANLPVIHINPNLNKKNINSIDLYIQNLEFEKMVHKSYPSMEELLNKAKWIENVESDNYIQTIESMCKSENLSTDFLKSILQREQIYSYTNQPVISLVYSQVPTNNTRIVVTTLSHRIKKGNNKIRFIILLELNPEDKGLIFKFQKELFHSNLNLNDLRFIKTKKEFLEAIKKD